MGELARLKPASRFGSLANEIISVIVEVVSGRSRFALGDVVPFGTVTDTPKVAGTDDETRAHGNGRLTNRSEGSHAAMARSRRGDYQRTECL